MTMVSVELDSSSIALPIATPKEMISVSKDERGRTKVRINYSSMDTIQNCMRKAMYSLHQKWKAADESAATLFGTAVHKFMEVFYAGEPSTRILPKLETLELMAYGHEAKGEDTDLVLRAMRAFVNAAQPLAALPETDKHSIVNGAWILHCYVKVFLDDPYVAMTGDDGKPCVEKTFSLVVHEDETLVVELFGTIDAIFRNVKTGDITPGDHKTAGFLNFNGSSYFDREKPAHQYTGYLLGAREVFGIKTDQFIVNIIEKKSRPKGATAKGVSFPRQITTRNEDDFNDFKEALVYETRRYLTAIETGVWPQGPVGACTAYGACSFRQVCSVPKSMRETLLRNKFTQGSAT